MLAHLSRRSFHLQATAALLHLRQGLVSLPRPTGLKLHHHNLGLKTENHALAGIAIQVGGTLLERFCLQQRLNASLASLSRETLMHPWRQPRHTPSQGWGRLHDQRDNEQPLNAHTGLNGTHHDQAKGKDTTESHPTVQP